MIALAFSWTRLLWAAAAFGFGGLLTALPYALDAESPSERMGDVALPIFVAAAVVGAACWALFCTPVSSRLRAVAAGAVFGVAAHPPAILFVMLTSGEVSGLPSGTLNIGALAGTTFYISIFSLISFGWLSVLLGIAAGLALERLEARTR